MNNIDQYRELNINDTMPDETRRQLSAVRRMAEREAWQIHTERETLRKIEDDILAQPATTAHLHEVIGQINEHRASGNYTTQHR